MALNARADMERSIDAEKTRLRILQLHGQKLAIRLEEIFWSQLTELAKDDKTTLSRLVFRLLDKAPKTTKNRTSFLRCYCIDRLRKRQPLSLLSGPAFDLLSLVSTCPVPTAVLTPERKIAAVNPALSTVIRELRTSIDDAPREINLTFSEPFPRIQKSLIDHPTTIKAWQIGLQAGSGKPRQFTGRFSLADREKGMTSLIVVFLER
jgi:predicted DNA-binding ribbon-helix-helix protein